MRLKQEAQPTLWNFATQAQGLVGIASNDLRNPWVRKTHKIRRVPTAGTRLYQQFKMGKQGFRRSTI